MKLVRATQDDSDYFEALFRTAYAEVVEVQFGGWSDAEYRKVFEEIWRDQEFDKIVVKGQVVGAVWVEKHTQFWRLREVIIEPAHQGKGFGSTTIRRCMDEAGKSGVQLRLRVLNKSRAVALYRRLGFREVRRDPTHLYMVSGECGKQDDPNSVNRD